MGLTEEQKRRIEENRLKALAKRRQGAINVQPSPGSVSKAQINSVPFVGSSTPVATRPPTSSVYPSTAIKPITGQTSRPSPLGSSAVSQSFYGNGSASSSRPNLSSGSVSGPTTKPTQPGMPLGKVTKGQCVLISGDQFRCEIPYHAAAISIFKSMPTGRYNSIDRQWSFSLGDHEELIRKLRPLRPEVDVEPLPRMVINILEKNKNVKRKEIFVNSDQEESFQIEQSLWDTLMPFQRDGVLYALQHAGRLLLADDMGLGKTIQALAIADAFKSDWPLLIVCPSSMRFSWKTSILKWMPSIPEDEIRVITGGKDFLSNVRVIIINYDLLSKKQQELVDKKVQIIIYDECHFLKSSKSQRCKAAEAISKSAKRMILLSGTPALSRPSELYSQICLVDPTLFPYFTDFGMRYCNGRKISYGPGREGFDFSGSSNMHELKLVMEQKCMIRRLKVDVMSQLPSKQRQVVELDPSIVGSKHSGQMLSQAKQMQSQSLSKGEKRGILLEWFHSTAAAKEKAVLEYIKDLLEGGKKFICFAHHQVMIKSIASLMDKQKVGYIRIDGATSSFNREQHCKEFQTQDSTRVALLSITAANSGITLTAAQLVVFAELFWNPGILIQAEDRAHRIGQTCCVTVQYLVANGTADDELWPMIQNKLNVLSKVGLGNENFVDSETANVQHKATRLSSGGNGKITDYFSTSFSEEDLEQIFNDDDEFEAAACQLLPPDEKRPKL